MSDITLPVVTLGSRAVRRRVEAGSMSLCAHCDQQVKFAAKLNRQQVIANVYVDAKWDRVEHYHDECYDLAGEPYGPAADQVLGRNGRRG